jgi:hypothetical protein
MLPAVAACAFCDRDETGQCPACRRATCSHHRAVRAAAFCGGCEAEWSRGERRRTIILAGVALAAFVITSLTVRLFGGDPVHGRTWLVVPMLATFGAMRGLRRTFRPSVLPEARTQR